MINRIRFGLSEFWYNLKNKIIQWLLPKCDFCGQPAYFEHFPNILGQWNCKVCEELNIDGWVYVCWECSLEDHEGHGSVWL